MLNFYIKDTRIFTLKMLSSIIWILEARMKICEFLCTHHLISDKLCLKWSTKIFSDFNFMMHELTNLLN